MFSQLRVSLEKGVTTLFKATGDSDSMDLSNETIHTFLAAINDEIQHLKD